MAARPASLDPATIPETSELRWIIGRKLFIYPLAFYHVNVKRSDEVPNDKRRHAYDTLPTEIGGYGRELKSIPMFTHAEVWHGIDRLAAHHGLTASGLARRAGLDPTAFNPSKRITKQAKPRWPSTESLAKVLDATQTPFASFVALMTDQSIDGAQPVGQRIRCLAFDQLQRDGLFDEAGFPAGDQWDEVEFPSLDDGHTYAVEVRGDRMGPLYRDGDLLIVSPTANIRRRDRVLLKHRAGPVHGGVLVRRVAQRVTLAPFAADGEEQVHPVGEIAWLARIVWASQ